MAVRNWVTSVITDKELGRAEYLTCEVCGPAVAVLRPYVNITSEAELVRLIGKVCQLLDLAPADDICEDTVATYAVILSVQLLVSIFKVMISCSTIKNCKF